MSWKIKKKEMLLQATSTPSSPKTIREIAEKVGNYSLLLLLVSLFSLRILSNNFISTYILNFFFAFYMCYIHTYSWCWCLKWLESLFQMLVPRDCPGRKKRIIIFGLYVCEMNPMTNSSRSLCIPEKLVHMEKHMCSVRNHAISLYVQTVKRNLRTKGKQWQLLDNLRFHLNTNTTAYVRMCVSGACKLD